MLSFKVRNLSSSFFSGHVERNRHGFLRICIRSGGSAADVVDDDSSALSMMGDVNINKQRGTTCWV